MSEHTQNEQSPIYDPNEYKRVLEDLYDRGNVVVEDLYDRGNEVQDALERTDQEIVRLSEQLDRARRTQAELRSYIREIDLAIRIIRKEKADGV